MKVYHIEKKFNEPLASWSVVGEGERFMRPVAYISKETAECEAARMSREEPDLLFAVSDNIERVIYHNGKQCVSNSRERVYRIFVSQGNSWQQIAKDVLFFDMTTADKLAREIVAEFPAGYTIL